MYAEEKGGEIIKKNKEIAMALIELLDELNEGFKVKNRRPLRYRVRYGRLRVRINLPIPMKALIKKVRDVDMRIYPNDHEPPHFHAISRGNFDVRVSIESGEVISVKSGKLPGKYKRIIEDWAQKNSITLKSAWDSSRPTELIVYSA